MLRRLGLVSHFASEPIKSQMLIRGRRQGEGSEDARSLGRNAVAVRYEVWVAACWVDAGELQHAKDQRSPEPALSH